MYNEDKNSKLPKGWRRVKLGEVATYINGKAFKPSEWSNEGLPIIRIQNLNRDRSEFNYCNFKVDEKYFVDNGDLLFAWSGTPDTSFGAHLWKGQKAVLNQHIFRIVINEQIIGKRYYLYALNHKVKEFVSKAHGTAGLAHITKKKFEESEIYLPPLAHQTAIVSKIDELLSELDKGKQQLETAQQQLRMYRQAVLKWAFEGKLTNSEVKEGKLSAGWKLVKIDEVTISLDNKRKPINKTERLRRVGNVPYYGANGRVGWIDDYIFDEPLVCVVEDETFTGREIPFSYKITGKAWVNNHAHVLKAKEGLSLDFLNYQLAYYPFLRLTTGTTGRKKLTKNALMNAPIKLCTLEEQELIVQEIESRLSVCDKVTETITTSLEQAETLRQSILKKAFEGKLIS